ncbi:MAG: histidinol dehydrogenase, partial [Thermodesulfobacteriota bacterium]
MPITPIATSSPAGQAKLAQLRDRFQLADTRCQEAVAAILADVRTRGDEAVVEYTRKFDAPALTVEHLRVSDEELREAFDLVEENFLDTLEIAIERIYSFHEHEKEQSWMVTREDGTITGRIVNPVDRAGLYVPGGQGGSTPLVSSVLMNGIPAAIAGVERRVMVTPPNQGGKIAPALLVAAQEIGITEIYKA